MQTKQFLLVLLSVLGLLLFSNRTYAQYPMWETFGTGQDGNIDHSYPGPLLIIADDCRAKVIGIQTIGSNTVLTIGNQQGIGSVRWDPSLNGGYQTKAIIVDFNMPPGFRNYDLAKIQSVTYWPYAPYVATITLDRIIPNIATTVSAILTEIVLIHEWHNVVLYDSLYTGYLDITCNPWDSTTGCGGVCCFYCDGTLTGGPAGQVNADGCGWAPYYNGGGAVGAPAPSIIGTPGTGGAALGGNAGNASLSLWPYGFPYLGIYSIDYGDYIPGNCTGSHYGGNGGYGAISRPGSGPDAGKPGTGYPGADWSTLYIGMGNSSAGGSGGQGAGAGGFGGGGGGAYVAGQTAPSTLPGAPSIGDASGGVGGSGARGGGFIYVRAENINLDTLNDSVFVSRGAGGGAGYPAYPLDSAGMGGDGGNGAPMYVSGATVYPSGGGGVEGEQGNGADGGQGAKGGNAGFVWIVYNANNNASGKNIIAKGGPGAIGGVGSKMGRPGHHGTHGTEASVCPPTFDTSYCHPYYGSTTVTETFCSCFNAYRALSLTTSYTYSGGTYRYSNSGDTDYKAYKNSSTLMGEIDNIVRAPSCTVPGYISDTFYKCTVNCSPPPTFFSTCTTHTAFVDTSGAGGRPKGIGWGNVVTNYNDGFVSKDVVTVDPGVNVTWQDTLYTDNTKTSPLCTGTCVFAYYGTNTDSGGDPRNGFDFSHAAADSGAKSTAEIHQDVNLQVNTEPSSPAPRKQNQQYLNDSFSKMANLVLMNAPVSSIISANFTADGIGPYYITVTDMLGRQWFTQTLNVPYGSNSIDISVGGWKPGSYILTLWHGNTSAKRVFVITGQ